MRSLCLGREAPGTSPAIKATTRAKGHRGRESRCALGEQSRQPLPGQRKADGRRRPHAKDKFRGRRAMNTLTARSSRPSLRAVLMIKVTVGAMCILFAIAELARAQTRSVEPGLIAHEWVTFTPIAGGDAQALQELPLTPSAHSPPLIHRDWLQ